MTISFWRYSHLALAISSFIFLLIASLTGVMLALEPVSNKLHDYHIANSSDLSLAKTINIVNEKYEEVLSISKDSNDFILISVITENGNEKFYIDPFTGEKIGDLIEKSQLFHFATNLHRSLFLKSLGRIFIGVTSFLLFLISISGVFLIIRRQGSVKQFFSKIVKENFSQFYHIVFGRFTLIPIIILSLTGAYLSLLRFDIIPKTNLEHRVDYDNIKDTPQIEIKDFDVFTSNTLAALRELEFPFSEDVEDYYYLKLDKKEVFINQYTGDILSEQAYPFVALLSRLNFTLHTGSGSMIWSIIIGIASLAIPFFMVSGFTMTLKRRKSKIKNKYGKDKAKYIILIGSEGGSTLQFANMLHNQLLKLGETSFVAEMNDFSAYKKMEHMVVITATYGQGEAPINANKFEKKYTKAIKKLKPFSYSVVGFGSLSYPDYCKFSFETDVLINNTLKSNKLLDVHAINNQSFESFCQWCNQWSEKVGLKIELPKEEVTLVKRKTTSFKIKKKTKANQNSDATFLIAFESVAKQKYQSGDLLAVYPKNENRERLYSIGVLNGEKEIQLSVKKHEFGACSSYLDNLELEENIEAYLIKNKSFHFPKRSKKVIMICTGTGIGPFLGMIENNSKNKEIDLYWGARTKDSFELYKGNIEKWKEENKLNQFIPAYSRAAKTKVYVQDLIERDRNYMAETLKNKGVIMICGSINMQKEVVEILKACCMEINGKPLSYYQNKKQILMDCY